MKYQVTANNIEMGVFEADSEDEVLDVYARDACYQDFQDLLDRVPGSSRADVDIVEMADE